MSYVCGLDCNLVRNDSQISVLSWVRKNFLLKKNIDVGPFGHTVFDLITAHTPISAQSRNSVVFRLQPVYFFLYFFTKAYVVGTHLNCIDKSMQFK